MWVPAWTIAALMDVELSQCRLELGKERFSIECPSRKDVPRVGGPMEWLAPPAEVGAEEDNYVSSFRYGPDVTAVDVAKNVVALHISSYDLMTEGSAQAAAGRDVFLFVDVRTSTLRPAGPELGITRERLRSDGCFRAVNHRFFLADVDQDGALDLGALREELECRVREGADAGAWYNHGPFDCPQPVRWYLFTGGGWKAAPQHDGLVPKERRELPLLGIVKSPVDFVRSLGVPIQPCHAH